MKSNTLLLPALFTSSPLVTGLSRTTRKALFVMNNAFLVCNGYFNSFLYNYFQFLTKSYQYG